MKQKQKTLVVIKPDGVQRSLIGEIIKRFEQVGLKLVGMKMTTKDRDFIAQHYSISDSWKINVGEKTLASYKKQDLTPPTEDKEEMGTMILEWLQDFMSSGPVVAMVWEGSDSIPLVRKLVGGTEPLTSDVGTIRGDYVLDSYVLANNDKRSIRNVIHASENIEDAEREIPLWFDIKEICNYRLVQDAILYDVNLDGLLE